MNHSIFNWVIFFGGGAAAIKKNYKITKFEFNSKS